MECNQAKEDGRQATQDMAENIKIESHNMKCVETDRHKHREWGKEDRYGKNDIHTHKRPKYTYI